MSCLLREDDLNFRVKKELPTFLSVFNNINFVLFFAHLLRSLLPDKRSLLKWFFGRKRFASVWDYECFCNLFIYLKKNKFTSQKSQIFLKAKNMLEHANKKLFSKIYNII